MNAHHPALSVDVAVMASRVVAVEVASRVADELGAALPTGMDDAWTGAEDSRLRGIYRILYRRNKRGEVQAADVEVLGVLGRHLRLLDAVADFRRSEGSGAASEVERTAREIEDRASRVLGRRPTIWF
ncbi:hypothetical protein [Nocardiopsis rhodophaea]|uniref:hypothetical protein n=1 Tax=Nocardiopsis rhodophaea TaxID=280238 RepID=UPI0031E08BB4